MTKSEIYEPIIDKATPDYIVTVYFKDDSYEMHSTSEFILDKPFIKILIRGYYINIPLSQVESIMIRRI